MFCEPSVKGFSSKLPSDLEDLIGPPRLYAWAHAVATITDIGIWAICPGRSEKFKRKLLNMKLQPKDVSLNWSLVVAPFIVPFQLFPAGNLETHGCPDMVGTRSGCGFTKWWLEQLQPTSKHRNQKTILKNHKYTTKIPKTGRPSLKKGPRRLRKMDERFLEPPNSHHERFWNFWKTG